MSSSSLNAYDDRNNNHTTANTTANTPKPTWNSFHHIKRTSVTSTPRSGITDDDEIGYTSHRLRSTTSKRETKKRKDTRLTQTVSKKGRGGSHNNKRNKRQGTKIISSRSRMNVPGETNSSTMRRRLSHHHLAEDLSSHTSNSKNVAVPWVSGKYSKRRRSNVAVIIDRIVFIDSFLFYCLLLNHSFPTNPNRITNCFKLFSLLQTYNYIAPASLF